LGLNRHVQSGHWLIGDKQFWLKCQRSGEANTLALATRELVRVAQDCVLRDTDLI
jgi:hypothetical protein